MINKQVEFFCLCRLRKYDEELFTRLFGVTNKIKIYCIKLNLLLTREEMNKICAKLYKKFRSLETQHIFSNYVSCFI